MKRGPKIKLRTKDGEAIKENTTYYVVSKTDRLPKVKAIKTMEYPETFGKIRHKYIRIRFTEIGNSFTSALKNDASYSIFADRNNAKRYQKYLAKVQMRNIREKFNSQLEELKALV